MARDGEVARSPDVPQHGIHPEVWRRLCAGGREAWSVTVRGGTSRPWLNDHEGGTWGVPNQRTVPARVIANLTAAQTFVALQIPLHDRDEVPVLSALPEEDFWQNPTAPVVGRTNSVAIPQWRWDEQTPEAPAQPVDEDFWQNPVAPIPARLWQFLPLGDPEEVPAGSLFGQYDEDFWTNPVASVPARTLVILPLGDPEEIPVATLFGQPDEDFWSNPVAPKVGLHYVQLPLGDPEEIPVDSLSGQPDEDFWANPVAPVPLTIRVALPLGDPEEVPGDLSGQPDEDFWALGPFPATASTNPLAIPQWAHDEQEPGELTGQPDEDFWQNPIAPVGASVRVQLPLGDPEELPGDLTGLPDEDYDLHLWLPTTVPASTNPASTRLSDDQEIQPPPVASSLDEDRWSLGSAASAQTWHTPAPAWDDPVIVPQPVPPPPPPPPVAPPIAPPGGVGPSGIGITPEIVVVPFPAALLVPSKGPRFGPRPLFKEEVEEKGWMHKLDSRSWDKLAADEETSSEEDPIAAGPLGGILDLLKSGPKASSPIFSKKPKKR